MDAFPFWHVFEVESKKTRRSCPVNQSWQRVSIFCTWHYPTSIHDVLVRKNAVVLNTLQRQLMHRLQKANDWTGVSNQMHIWLHNTTYCRNIQNNDLILHIDEHCKMKIISFHVPTQSRLEQKRMHQFICSLPTKCHLVEYASVPWWTVKTFAANVHLANKDVHYLA